MDRMIELSPRLAAVGRLVPPGLPLVDVGTDHAYLPAALVQMGRIPSAVAADLRQGPLSRARETVREHGLTAKITFRLCDGLTGIRPEEAGSVAIAGMGGETIAHILAAAPWVRERAVPLILQPMSSQSDLRLWLQQNGYAIAGEKLAREGDAIYTVMLVRAGEMAPDPGGAGGRAAGSRSPPGRSAGQADGEAPAGIRGAGEIPARGDGVPARGAAGPVG